MRKPMLLVASAFATAMTITVAASPWQATHATAPASTSSRNDTACAFKQEMRKLWTDHVVWARDYIIAALDDQGDAQAAATRLMKNQTDIGAAIVPYYGADAGNQLTALLKDHISIEFELIKVAKAGETNTQMNVMNRGQQNAAQFGDFLSKANPNLPRATMVQMMQTHLDTTRYELISRLTQDWEMDVRSFDSVYNHILKMSDALSEGIIKQFPNKFAP